MRAVNEHSGRSEPELPTLFLEFHGAPAAVEEEIETVREIAAEHGGGEFAWAATTQERAAMWRARHQAYFAGPRAAARRGRLHDRRLRADLGARRDDRARRAARRASCRSRGRWSATSPTATSTASCSSATATRASARSPRSSSRRSSPARTSSAGPARASTASASASARRCVAEVGEEGIEAMRAIKRALDPLNLLNPGKVLLDAPRGAPLTRGAGSDRPPAAQRRAARRRLLLHGEPRRHDRDDGGAADRPRRCTSPSTVDGPGHHRLPA